MQIWKYVLEVSDYQIIYMPKGAKILSVQLQNGSPCLWALVDPDAPTERRAITTYGTGQPMSTITPKCVFLGTYLIHWGALVLHVFEQHIEGE